MNNIDSSWIPLFSSIPNLDDIYNSDQIIYPPKELVFKVFELSVYDI